MCLLCQLLESILGVVNRSLYKIMDIRKYLLKSKNPSMSHFNYNIKSLVMLIAKKPIPVSQNKKPKLGDYPIYPIYLIYLINLNSKVVQPANSQNYMRIN